MGEQGIIKEKVKKEFEQMGKRKGTKLLLKISLLVILPIILVATVCTYVSVKNEIVLAEDLIQSQLKSVAYCVSDVFFGMGEEELTYEDGILRDRKSVV